MTGIARQLWVLAAVIGFGFCVTFTARAADDVANPQYGAWAKFKPRSSSTLVCDAKVGPNAVDMYVEMTVTLVSVTPELVTVENLSKVTAMGHTNNPTPNKREIKSMAPAKDVKEAGTKDIEAAGKKYTCKVLELTGDSAASNGAKGSPKPGTDTSKIKATLYVNADVPGGLVKMDWTGADGKTMTFNLTAVEVK